MSRKERYYEVRGKMSISEIRQVALGKSKLRLSETAIQRVKNARKALETMLEVNERIYGVNTGVGALQDTKRPINDSFFALGKKILRSHATGVGKATEDHIVRGAMTLLVNSLAKGHSGVRKRVIDVLIAMLNEGILPFVPRKGSVGSSGDLAPLAHMALPLIGEGEVIDEGERVKSIKILKRENLSPLKLDPREALALVNGTYFMTSLSLFNVANATKLITAAEITAALSFEALKAHSSPLDPKLNELRPHPGQQQTAKFMRLLLQGSSLVDSKKENVQDAYSLRCVPQVIGTVRDALTFSRSIIEREINSVTDNPLLFWEDEVKAVSGGNFHGSPIALSQENLGTAIASLANISERRIARLLDEKLSDLPAFLTPDPNNNSGFMLMQYTAAALVAENKVLAHPVNVDSLPTSANQEDYNNFGLVSARKTKRILEHACTVIAIEALCAAQAIDLTKRAKDLGKGTRKAYKCIRQDIPFLKQDSTPLYELINKAEDLIREGSLTEAVRDIR